MDKQRSTKRRVYELLGLALGLVALFLGGLAGRLWSAPTTAALLILTGLALVIASLRGAGGGALARRMLLVIAALVASAAALGAALD